MKILFLGDIVGPSGCMVVKKYLKKIVEENKINFEFFDIFSKNFEKMTHSKIGIDQKL